MAISLIGHYTLTTGREDIVFQVLGETPTFVKNVKYTKPESSTRYTGNLFMSERGAQDIEALKQHVATVPVDSENPS